MKFEVTKVLLHEDVSGTATLPYEVTVIVSDDQQKFHDSATVEVFVERDDVSLSEIRSRALEKARQFLNAAAAAQPTTDR